MKVHIDIYAWIIPLLSLCVGIIILDIWKRVGRFAFDFFEDRHDRNIRAIENEDRVDYGLLYLSVALIVWFFSGTISNIIDDGNSKTLIKGIFSTFNSVCLLFSISYFECSPKFIKNNTSTFRNSILVAAFVVISSAIYLFMNRFYTAMELPDFLFSVPTAIVIGYVYFKTFYTRKFNALAYFTILIILLVLFSQTLIFENIDSLKENSIYLFIKPFSRLSFIFIICFLGYSWEHERYSTTLAKYEALIEKNDQISWERDKLVESSSSEARDSVWKEVSLKAAHKLGNPLDAIEVCISSLNKNLTKSDISETEYKKLNQIILHTREKINKAKRLIQEFKAFGSQMTIKLHEHDLMQVIDEFKEVVEENDIEFVFNNRSNFEIIIPAIQEKSMSVILRKTPGIMIKIDSDRIRDCLDELFSNSLKWFPKSGEKRVTISIEDCDENDLKLMRDDTLTKKDIIKIVYTDNGKGIKEVDKNLVFAPFFTNDNQGTGMGLSIVGKIIKLHRGIIFENGEFGRGARFVIILPTKSR